jgi:uncharacterized protein YcfL
MKKVILVLSVIGLMTACGSSSEAEAPKTDSTVVAAVDTTAGVSTESVVFTDSTAVSTATK